jgi:hypothetical protein
LFLVRHYLQNIKNILWKRRVCPAVSDLLLLPFFWIVSFELCAGDFYWKSPSNSESEIQVCLPVIKPDLRKDINVLLCISNRTFVEIVEIHNARLACNFAAQIQLLVTLFYNKVRLPEIVNTSVYSINFDM